MTQPDRPRYEMVMPFLPVQSNDGPFEDSAYCAGWEMGMLDGELRLASPKELAVTILIQNRVQADLIAMRYGYEASFVDYHDGWIGLFMKREQS